MKCHQCGIEFEVEKNGNFSMFGISGRAELSYFCSEECAEKVGECSVAINGEAFKTNSWRIQKMADNLLGPK